MRLLRNRAYDDLIREIATLRASLAYESKMAELAQKQISGLEERLLEALRAPTVPAVLPSPWVPPSPGSSATGVAVETFPSWDVALGADLANASADEPLDQPSTEELAAAEAASALARAHLSESGGAPPPDVVWLTQPDPEPEPDPTLNAD